MFLVIALLASLFVSVFAAPNTAEAANPWSTGSLNIYNANGTGMGVIRCKVSYVTITGGWRDTFNCTVYDTAQDGLGVFATVWIKRTTDTSWLQMLGCFNTSGSGTSKVCGYSTTMSSARNWKNYQVKVFYGLTNNGSVVRTFSKAYWPVPNR